MIMLVTTLIPLLFLGGFAYTLSSRSTEAKTEQAGIDTLRQMEGNLGFILQDVENMSIFLIGQGEIAQYLRGQEDDQNARERVLGFTTNLVSSKKYISDITIYPANPKIAPLSTTTIYSSNLESELNVREVKQKMWTGLYTVETYAGLGHVFSFIRPLRTAGNYQTVGWLSISLDESIISKYWSEPKLAGGQGEVALLNEKGMILSATDKSWLSRSLESLLPGITSAIRPGMSGAATYREGHAKKTVLTYEEPLVGWKLVGLIPFEQYQAQSRYILQLTAVAVAIAVLATAGLILFLIQRVTNPLQTLARLLSKVNPEEPLPQYPANSDDEIGKLAESYNMLGTHIEKLKRELIQSEARKKEADMRALQAQINPHFLYNTLSSIHWIALLTEEKRIADMVGALSDFLRFSLNKGKEFCPVHQELSHIKNYVQVQSIRFPDQFDVDIVADPELQDKLMLKLLLQPLVENAMIHGVQKKEGKGMITVFVERQGSRMSFLVLDDGVGMSEELLQLVRSSIYAGGGEDSPDTSYGLRNVNERLLLHYGPEAGLTIESKPQAGTRVSFSIPIMEEEHENHDRG